MSLGFIKDLVVVSGGGGDTVSFKVELTTPACPVKEQFKQVRRAIQASRNGSSRHCTESSSYERAVFFSIRPTIGLVNFPTDVCFSFFFFFFIPIPSSSPSSRSLSSSSSSSSKSCVELVEALPWAPAAQVTMTAQSAVRGGAIAACLLLECCLAG